MYITDSLPPFITLFTNTEVSLKRIQCAVDSDEEPASWHVGHLLSRDKIRYTFLLQRTRTMKVGDTSCPVNCCVEITTSLSTSLSLSTAATAAHHVRRQTIKISSTILPLCCIVASTALCINGRTMTVDSMALQFCTSILYFHVRVNPNFILPPRVNPNVLSL